MKYLSARISLQENIKNDFCKIIGCNRNDVIHKEQIEKLTMLFILIILVRKAKDTNTKLAIKGKTNTKSNLR